MTRRDCDPKTVEFSYMSPEHRDRIFARESSPPSQFTQKTFCPFLYGLRSIPATSLPTCTRPRLLWSGLAGFLSLMAGLHAYVYALWCLFCFVWFLVAGRSLVLIAIAALEYPDDRLLIMALLQWSLSRTMHGFFSVRLFGMTSFRTTIA